MRPCRYCRAQRTGRLVVKRAIGLQLFPTFKPATRIRPYVCVWCKGTGKELR